MHFQTIEEFLNFDVLTREESLTHVFNLIESSPSMVEAAPDGPSLSNRSQACSQGDETTWLQWRSVLLQQGKLLQ